MKRYFIRTLKFTIYLIAILFVILIFIYFMSVMPEDASFWRLFEQGRPLEMLFLFVAFAVIYPFIGFVTVKIYINKPLDDDKNKILELFAQRKYMLISDENKTLTFRPKNKLHRLTRMYEDALELNYSDTILKFRGLRRDIYRIKRALEELARQSAE